MRLGSISYDDTAQAKHQQAAEICISLGDLLSELAQSRAQALAITKLEECFMWLGAALRDDQIRREHHAQPDSPPSEAP